MIPVVRGREVRTARCRTHNRQAFDASADSLSILRTTARNESEFQLIRRKSGEPARNRTENPQIKSLLLYQLSYWPTCTRVEGV